MSMKQTIMTAVLSYLNGISIANGYSINISGNVYEWPDSDIPKSITYAIIVRDPHDEIMEGDVEEHRVEYEVVMRVVGNTSPTLLRAIQQDILTAFSQVETLSGVEGAEYESSDVEVEKEQHRMAYIAMYFSVYYRSEEWTI